MNKERFVAIGFFCLVALVSLAVFGNSQALTYNSSVNNREIIPSTMTATNCIRVPASASTFAAGCGGTGVTASTLSVSGNAFSVGGSTLVVAGGSVGIGTTAPAYPLQVIGEIQSDTPQSDTKGLGGFRMGSVGGSGDGTRNFAIRAAAASGDVAFDIYGGSTWAEMMRITNTGNVGIGTTSPASKMDVRGTSSFAGVEEVLQIHGGNFGVQEGPQITFMSANPTYPAARHAAINGGQVTGDSGFGGGLSFLTNGDTGGTSQVVLSTRVVIRANGNVGIGTTSPGETLDVNGGIKRLSKTKAQLEALTPSGSGVSYYCSDCLNAVHVVISTGSAISQFDSYTGGTSWH